MPLLKQKDSLISPLTEKGEVGARRRVSWGGEGKVRKGQEGEEEKRGGKEGQGEGEKVR